MPDRTKDDEKYMREMNKMNPDDFPLDIDMEDDFDFPEELNKKQLKDLIGKNKKKKKIKVAKKKGKMRMMAKEGDFVDREEFESEKEKKEADMNKKAGGGMIKKYSGGGAVTSPKQQCRGGGAATRGLGFTIS
jgi:hypothetical protein